jgi:nucleoside-diphosphate-sugar epimerase
MIELRGVTTAVTGGAGLIGSYLVEQLVAVGAHVVVIDDFSKGTRENLAAVEDRIDIREGDMESSSFTHDALDGCGLVFHLASRAYGVGYGQGHHLEIMAHNERITTNVIEALERQRPQHVLMASSSCVYDDSGPDTLPELPLFEGSPERVNKGYGWAKRFLEQKSTLLAEETGVPVTIVRPFNIYGERYRWVGQYSQAIPMLVKRIMDGENPVMVWGSGNQRRSYIHAHDCARMMMGLAKIEYTAGPVNIGTQETISMRDLVTLICEVARVTPELSFDRGKPEGRVIKSSNTALFNAIMPAFEFEVPFREGLTRMLEWYRKTFESGVAQ